MLTSFLIPDAMDWFCWKHLRLWSLKKLFLDCLPSLKSSRMWLETLSTRCTTSLSRQKDLMDLHLVVLLENILALLTLPTVSEATDRFQETRQWTRLFSSCCSWKIETKNTIDFPDNQRIMKQGSTKHTHKWKYCDTRHELLNYDTRTWHSSKRNVCTVSWREGRTSYIGIIRHLLQWPVIFPIITWQMDRMHILNNSCSLGRD